MWIKVTLFSFIRLQDLCQMTKNDSFIKKETTAQKDFQLRISAVSVIKSLMEILNGKLHFFVKWTE